MRLKSSIRVQLNATPCCEYSAHPPVNFSHNLLCRPRRCEKNRIHQPVQQHGLADPAGRDQGRAGCAHPLNRRDPLIIVLCILLTRQQRVWYSWLRIQTGKPVYHTGTGTFTQGCFQVGWLHISGAAAGLLGYCEGYWR